MTNITDINPFVTDNANASAYWMRDILWVIKARGSQTGNAFSLLEQTMPYGSGAPPHMHPDMEEMFYVMEGQMTVCIDNKVSILRPGSFALIPRKTGHYFKVTSKENCRVLNMYTPSGFEEWVIKIAVDAQSLTLPPSEMREEINRITRKNAEKYTVRPQVGVDMKIIDLMNYKDN